MRVGSLFSGVAGFDLGFEQAGFETVWQVEREPFCIAVLKTRFPNVERYYDITLCGQGRRHKLSAVDVVTAGFPCQDLSVAGKRAGLGGTRSGLFWEVVRIVGELRPRWLVLENVPGLFSSDERRDFAIVLRELGKLGCFQSIAWTVLDSRYFGVAQRRRRVFIVCGAGIGSAEQVLFESEGGQRDFAPSGEERPGVARALANSAVSSGYRYDPNGEEYVVGSLAAHAREHGHAMSTQQAAESGQIVAATLSSANHDKSHAGGRRREDDVNLVAYCLREDPGGIGQGHNTNFVSATSDSNRVRDFAELPEGLDSARYRALGNAVTVSVSKWIAERIKAAHPHPNHGDR